MAASDSRRAKGARRAAGIIIVGTLIVRLISLIKEIVIAGRFGVRPEMDAFNVALAIPMMAGGIIVPAITGAVIPLMSAYEFRAGEGTAATRRAWASLFWITAAILGAAVVLLEAATPFIGKLLDGLSLLMGVRYPPASPGVRPLLAILAPMALLQGLGGVFSCPFTLRKRFLLPSLVVALFPAMIITTLLALPVPRVEQMAWAAIGGSVLMVMPLLPHALRQASLLSAPDWAIIREYGRKMVPLVLVMVFAQVSECLVYLLGAVASVGGAASLGYAQRLVDLPTFLFGIALSSAAFPYFSDSFAARDLVDLARLFRQSACQLVALMIPMTMGWFLFGRQVLLAIYQQGAFDDAAAQLTYAPLLLFAAGGTFKALSFLEGRFFMSLGRIRSLVLFGAGGLGVNVLLALVLGRFLGHRALALSLSASYVFIALGLLVLIGRSLKPHLQLLPLAATAWRALAASAGAGILGWAMFSVLPGGERVMELIRLAAGCSVFAATYALGGRFLGVRLWGPGRSGKGAAET